MPLLRLVKSRGYSRPVIGRILKIIMGNLLFEIGTEEIPAGYIEPALEQLKKSFSTKLKQLRVDFGAMRTLATPRRLTIIVENLAEKQEDISEELVGPSVKAGMKESNLPYAEKLPNGSYQLGFG